MGWKDLAKLGKDFVEAKKDELLTGDADKDAAARARASEAQSKAQSEATASFLEKVLPPDLANLVTAARPENVAAREAEKAVAAEAKRRTDLAARPTAQLRLTISGDEQGSVVVTLPFDRTEDKVQDAATLAPGEVAPMPWLRVLLEAPDPVPLGTTTLASLSVSVPGYRGVLGHYDLADLYRRGEAGLLESWEVFDLYLSPDVEAGEETWYFDTTSFGSVDVAESSLSFDLAMVSAANEIRATGVITWT